MVAFPSSVKADKGKVVYIWAKNKKKMAGDLEDGKNS
jgi:hypothetical protein